MSNLKISSVFEEGSYIPAEYSCQGRNLNPPLDLENIPENTKSLALIMDDPDAPMGTFVHWVAWNIPLGNILPNSSQKGLFSEGLNGAGKPGYTGPCPPIGHGIHHYHFKVYTLNKTLNLPQGTKKEDLEKAIEGNVISMGELVGLFERK